MFCSCLFDVNALCLTGDLYTQAHTMFDADMYLQLLAILHLAIRSSKSSGDMESEIQENLPPVQRTILEILPLLRPAKHLSSMWSQFIKALLCYLIGYEARSHKIGNDMEFAVRSNHDHEGLGKDSHNFSSSSPENKSGDFTNHKEINMKPKPDVANGASSVSMRKSQPSFLHSATSDDTASSHLSPLFGEKLLPVIVKLYLEASPTEKCCISAEILHALGR
ncbi:hypothetical protein BHE74_00006299 [Ensete ventricosum]|uniref:Uncharacterized protein n=1 Tax=Ensete ventricosum TaxID=4639 RepID=A0A444FJT8_ENSVE|nr:hypothetical protein B296_00047698 [Ensete ventricosum]RWW22897.1 hypothetical protein GW17_00012881 [Ensete ventricosum]RWW85057.1 hypothetical protein BHE74_00006299 [Ensete ventricosum]